MYGEVVHSQNNVYSVLVKIGTWAKIKVMLKDIKKNRIKKLETLRKAGINPYPARVMRSHVIGEVLNSFRKLSRTKKSVSLAGRVMAIREHGGSTFVDLLDASGKIQCYFKKDVLKRKYDLFVENIDIGDFVGVSGYFFETKKGEKTLGVKAYDVLAKSFLPLPEKWHGLQDIDERYRKRNLDLLFNIDIKEKFILRSRIIEAIRSILGNEGFLEVETPTLQPIHGGALARPFKTHLNALNMDLYLRVAPELYLKRLLVGGFEKIYEMGRCFRNEGMDRSHNPEFSMLELYWAYIDYQKLMDFVENFFRRLTRVLFRKTAFIYEEHRINMKGKWPRLEYDLLLKKYAKLDYYSSGLHDLEKIVKKFNIKVEKSAAKVELADEIYKKVVQSKLIKPTFVINHPIEISPLAKRLENDHRKAARFQLVVAGMELINGFSELNDPEDQLTRFKKQEKTRRAGGESHPMDKDFIEALEYGMPPAAGLGIGIDRLVALLTNSHSLREVILFPTMRSKK